MPAFLSLFLNPGFLNSIPRIDNQGRDVVEVLDVAGGEGGAGGEDDAGDHCVAEFSGAARLAPGGGQFGRFFGSSAVESDYSVLDDVRQTPRSLSKSVILWVRFFPSGIAWRPKRISKVATDVVQTER